MGDNLPPKIQALTERKKLRTKVAYGSEGILIDPHQIR